MNMTIHAPRPTHADRLRDFGERVHLYMLLRDFRPSELIAFFRENVGAADRALRYRDDQDWDSIDRLLARGLITRTEYAREQWWAEVASCAHIALESNVEYWLSQLQLEEVCA